MDTELQWTSTVVLGDGSSALLRPIRPDDAPALQAFHQRQSADSRYYRYFSPKPELSEAELTRFTTVDFVDRAAFVVEDRGELIGWASYERWQNRGDAEVAFQVDDHHQGKGVATLLLEHLAAVAAENGIEQFTAQTLADNRGMLAVFAKAGWPLHRRFDSGVIDVDFPLVDTSEFIDSVERREQRADSRAIARLLMPASIAVIGASDVPDSVGDALWRHVSKAPRCPVFAVNPHKPAIGDVATFASVVDIPDEVGLAVVAVPPGELHRTIDQCIEKRVRGAVVVTIDEDPTDIDALVAHARINGLRIIGPGSMGVASPRPDTYLQAALVDVRLPAGGVAVSMQSGTLGSSLLRMAADLKMGLSWFVSLGDKRDVSANDLLQFWEDDDATTVVALYTESLGNPKKLGRIARRVSAKRPIVAIRTGAALIGTANDALYRQTGVIEVPTVPALLDTARVFASQPLMAGDRVAIVSNSRSPEVSASATLAAAGLEAAEPAGTLDWRSTDDDYERVLADTLACAGVDAALVIHAPPVQRQVGAPIEAIERAVASAGGSKPVVAVMLGSGDGPLRPGSTIPSFAFPEQAAAVLGRVAAYSRWRAEEGREPARPLDHIKPAVAGRMIADHLDAGTMTPAVLRELLAAYGIEMPPTTIVDAADAVAAAERVGFPVAVKAEHRRRGRTIDTGIALELHDADDVATAVATMRTHLGDDAARVIVQQMSPSGLDLRIHSSLDERVGPIVTAGLGGAQADVIADESSRLAPVSPATARSLITATRAAAGLSDDALDRVADVITRVAQLASDHAEIAELDLNPVIVGDDGSCHVVDAAILLRRPARPERSMRRLD
jgi:acyl-CoA synthetase (NDP forming)/RimJ/RimL family protein N-acetyltransferase